MFKLNVTHRQLQAACQIISLYIPYILYHILISELAFLELPLSLIVVGQRLFWASSFFWYKPNNKKRKTYTVKKLLTMSLVLVIDLTANARTNRYFCGCLAISETAKIKKMYPKYYQWFCLYYVTNIMPIWSTKVK